MLLGCAYNNTHLSMWESLTANGSQPQAIEPAGLARNGERVIAIMLNNHRIFPPSVVVRQGEKVRLEIANLETARALEIAGYNIRHTLRADQKGTVQFDATRAGDFHLQCRPEDAAEGGPKGTLTVLPMNQTAWSPRRPMHGIASLLQPHYSSKGAGS